MATIKNKVLTSLLKKFQKRNPLPISFAVYTPDGDKFTVGDQKPRFNLIIKNKRGVSAILSLHELAIAEAYMEGNIDFEGNLVEIIQLKTALSDRSPWIKFWRRFKPLIVGRTKCNPAWIAKHYDSANIQLLSTDHDYDTYTQGNYENDNDSLEVGAKRKLDLAFKSLNIKEGDHVLDAGCGWGGFLRFAARKKAKVTGITLSRDQASYVEKLIEKEKLNAKVLYQDFFSYKPKEKYDAISVMGVIEDLSDYKRVVQQLLTLVKPGGRVYLDFAATRESFATGSFITKYIWPGTFRMVYMPEFIDAVSNSPFELIAIHNDRRNYYLWARKIYERWLENKDKVIAESNEILWRMFLLLFAGTSAIMKHPDYESTAYRVVLELPEDHIVNWNENKI